MVENTVSIKSKLPNAGISIFARMTALANQHNAINLAQGFPDFLSSKKLIELVHHYMLQGMNQYAPMPGVLSLRERIAEKVQHVYSAIYHPDTEVTITAGATQAIYTSIAATIRDGDEVIIFEPAYDSYAPAIRIHGGIPVPVELLAQDYRIDWENVKKLVTQRTRMIMINTPHNPTGTALTAADMRQLIHIVQGKDIIVLSDEVYEHIIFDGIRHESVMYYPELRDRSMVVFSFGKTYHNTGWKMGYVLAPEYLTRELRSVHQFEVFSVNTPIQYALADFMSDRSEYEQVSEFYRKKRDLFCNMLKDSRFTLKPSVGTYFQLLDYSNISTLDDQSFADELTISHKVASIPLSPFYRNGSQARILRFCFAKQDSTLQKAAEILCKI
jgi:methionine aminotransferase